ncbi:MAG: hypothetical protein V2A58_02675 [Planctomycetota bacterium]
MTRGFSTLPVRTLVALAALAACATGCANYTSAQRYQQGLVLVLPGIQGKGMLNRQVIRGLAKAGVPYALESYDWTTGVAPLFIGHQIDIARNRKQAELISQRILGYAKEYPDRPVWLVGHSAGGGVAVWTLEDLPEGFEVEGAVLLAPSLSQDYNLAKALSHARRGIYHYYSRRDVVFLGIGTSLVGNVDRGFEPTAGRTGFAPPTDLASEEGQLYETRLQQIDCSSGIRCEGHIGLHVTATSPSFVQRIVAPNIWTKGK